MQSDPCAQIFLRTRTIRGRKVLIDDKMILLMWVVCTQIPSFFFTFFLVRQGGVSPVQELARLAVWSYIGVCVSFIWHTN
jgi:hypothetical protein